MNSISTYIIIISLGYSLLIACFTLAWIKIKEFKVPEGTQPNTYISLVVAIKNEASNIEILLRSLSNQSLSQSHYEIILVDDHSSDSSVIIAKKYSRIINNLKIISLKDQESGKKSAVGEGISKAKGNLIVTTDADCTHNFHWLSTIAKFYEKYRPKLIVAPVLMSHTNVFESIQSLDFFSLMASGAASTGINQAIMCNGANLAFEKTSYMEFNDIHNKKYASGDDIFLLLNMKKKYRKEIKFLKSKHAVVTTNPEKTIKKYINQRTRWASKSKGYSDKFIILVSFLVLLVHLNMLISIIFAFFYPKMLWWFTAQFLSKSLIDLTFLIITSKFFNATKFNKCLIITQLLNVFLIPYFAFAGLLFRPKWK